MADRLDHAGAGGARVGEVPLRRPGMPLPAHALAAGWVAGVLLLGNTAPVPYELFLQEDRFVEWWTVTLFGAAGFFALRCAWRERRVFDALVGLFCVFVAGEEFSWGQRLFGLTPPAPFLEHNVQQELTLHNFADVFGQPKWVLIFALVGFGVVLPALGSWAPARRHLARIGATAASPPLAAWLAATALLLVWYPLPFTGEWSEALAGGLFLLAFVPAAGTAAWSLAGGALVAVALAWVSGLERGASEADLACARVEVEALAEDLAYGRGASGRLAGAASVHKRLFTSIEDGYVEDEGLDAFRAAACEGDASAGDRRRLGLDPWGTAYWVHLRRSDGSIRLTVYSFGPNRRRDAPPETGGGDDIAAKVEITL